MQQIPSKNRDIRLMFKAGYTYKDFELENNNSCILSGDTEVETIDSGWVKVVDLMQGSKVKDSDACFSIVQHIEKLNENKYKLSF